MWMSVLAKTALKSLTGPQSVWRLSRFPATFPFLVSVFLRYVVTACTVTQPGSFPVYGGCRAVILVLFYRVSVAFNCPQLPSIVLTYPQSPVVVSTIDG